MMLDLTPNYKKIESLINETNYTMLPREIGAVAYFFYRVPLEKIVAAFLEPGPPPAGLSSGDANKPGDFIIPNAGKAVPGRGQSGAAGTRKGKNKCTNIF
jgi:hypothetical protein